MWTLGGMMKLLIVVGVFSSLSGAEHVQLAIRRGEVKCKGVNLGGWLVAEHWMTYDSAIWRGVPQGIAEQGEFATMKHLGHEEGDRRFEEHRATWITAADVAEIARSGLNAVRVPVGYWIVGEGQSGAEDASPNAQDWQVFAPGAIKYLDELIRSWAVTHNVAVLLSLHAHRGSQNGKDHSAAPVFGAKNWAPHPSNVANSVDFALFLAARYRNATSFLGMSILNEPEYPTPPGVVRDYYRRVHGALRARGDDCVLVTAPMLSEQAPGFMADVLLREPNVWHEWHPYFKWGHEGRNERQLIASAVGYGAQVAQWQGNPLVISEWSLGVWDQWAPFTDAAELRRFGRAQQGAYAQARGGSFFWSWRHADDTMGKRCGWSLRGLLRAQVLVIA